MRTENKVPIGFTIALFLFWIASSQTLHPQHLVAGVVTVLAVVAFNRSTLSELRLGEYKVEFFNVVAIIGKLVVYIVRGNIEVARLVLSRDMPIQPQMITLRCTLSLPVTRAFLANAITLTPGTMTVDMEGDDFVVHCLTDSGAADLPGWELIGLIRRLEGR